MRDIYRPARGKEAQLRGLVGQKGYTLERSLTSYDWLLFGPDGEQAKDDKGRAVFTVWEAIQFLKGRPDAAHD